MTLSLEPPTRSDLNEAVTNLETSLALAQLEVLLGVYQEVADLLSGESAAAIVVNLKPCFETCATGEEKKVQALKQEAERLSPALGRAVDEWQADGAW